ncbi:methyl-accepting chemotaxis protein [Hyalangium versicolor]|uniref:methyl-accepting chemotaxis protein n=1 Tax=Hyalangium versicolor TaxID=2861190 RepID=UPI001CC9F71F|nr:methyl-accepting chemotaxis protein [Hyalangium versicolor]
MTLTFKQKMMLLPGLAAVFLLAILVISVVIGFKTTAAHARIEQGYAPALAQSQEMMAQLQTLHHELQDAVVMKETRRLEPMRALGRKLAASLESAHRNPVLSTQHLAVLQQDFGLYQQELEQAVELHARGDAQAEASLTRVNTRFESLQRALQLMVDEHRRGLEDAFYRARLAGYRSRILIGVLVALCILLLAGSAWWMVREVAEPLERLSKTAARIAFEGDLTLNIDVNARDEVGSLAMSLEALVNRLRSVPVALQGLVGELTMASERLTKVSQEQINFLTEQARSLSEAGTTMAEIAQTSSMASSRAETVLNEAERADSFTAASQRTIELSAQGLEQIRQRVSAMVGSIGQLSEQAVHAREIIGSVKDLADQSNVLALNAAIEASRAGEGGRGFSVVAREMRALSGQSLQRTERIGRILLDINTAIRQAVASAEDDSKQMEAGIDQVLSSANQLKEITSVMQQSSNAARQIVASVTQQNAGISQMTDVMTQLSGMMGDVVLATTTAEEAVGQINATVSQLRKIVSEFRV